MWEYQSNYVNVTFRAFNHLISIPLKTIRYNKVQTFILKSTLNHSEISANSTKPFFWLYVGLYFQWHAARFLLFWIRMIMKMTQQRMSVTMWMMMTGMMTLHSGLTQEEVEMVLVSCTSKVTAEDMQYRNVRQFTGGDRLLVKFSFYFSSSPFVRVNSIKFCIANKITFQQLFYPEYSKAGK